MAFEFTLTKTWEEALPEAVEVDGNVFSINTSFRAMLKILRIMDADDIIDWQKPLMLLKIFYGENAPNAEAGVETFMRFLYRDKAIKRESESLPPAFDYEVDAPEIYSSFLSMYGIDLLKTDMHWWRFCALLDGATWAESPIGIKVRLREKLRTVDPSKCDDPEAVKAAKKSIKLETKTSLTEQRERDAVYQALTGGGDVTAALEALKHGV